MVLAYYIGDNYYLNRHIGEDDLSDQRERGKKKNEILQLSERENVYSIVSYAFRSEFYDK